MHDQAFKILHLVDKAMDVVKITFIKMADHYTVRQMAQKLEKMRWFIDQEYPVIPANSKFSDEGCFRIGAQYLEIYKGAPNGAQVKILNWTGLLISIHDSKWPERDD